MSQLKALMHRSSTGLFAMSASPDKLKVAKGAVSLTNAEDRLFRTLLATVKHFNLKTTMRVAGGWVRDKMLGKESDDIDIALDNMMGKTFADKVWTDLGKMERDKGGGEGREKFSNRESIRVHILCVYRSRSTSTWRAWVSVKHATESFWPTLSNPSTWRLRKCTFGTCQWTLSI